MEGYVDASICGASTSVERSQLVEFSQALVSTTLAIITQTPDKSVSVSYFARKTNLNVHTVLNISLKNCILFLSVC